MLDRPSILNRCPLGPGELVPIVKSQENASAGVIRRAFCRLTLAPVWKGGGPVKEPAGVCQTYGTDLYLGVIAKGYVFRLRGMDILEDN